MNGELILPSKLQNLGTKAFENCSLIKIEFKGKDIKSIGERCFNGNNKLAEITFAGAEAEWESVEKLTEWDKGIKCYTVICSDTVPE